MLARLRAIDSVGALLIAAVGREKRQQIFGDAPRPQETPWLRQGKRERKGAREFAWDDDCAARRERACGLPGRLR